MGDWVRRLKKHSTVSSTVLYRNAKRCFLPSVVYAEGNLTPISRWWTQIIFFGWIWTEILWKIKAAQPPAFTAVLCICRSYLHYFGMKLINVLLFTAFFLVLYINVNWKVGTHEGTSPCDWSLRLVPCSVYTKEIVAGTSPLKKINLGHFNWNSPKCGDEK